MHTGKCLCGHVTLTIDANVDKVNVCHCGMCQVWNSGPGITIDCGNHIEIDGNENITRYKSSEWAERGFCKHCGTHLFYHLLNPSIYYVSAALFKESKYAVIGMQIYVDCKPKYYNFTEKTVMLSEQDILNMIKS